MKTAFKRNTFALVRNSYEATAISNHFITRNSFRMIIASNQDIPASGRNSYEAGFILNYAANVPLKNVFIQNPLLTEYSCIKPELVWKQARFAWLIKTIMRFHPNTSSKSRKIPVGHSAQASSLR
jgi:hypothetical protein